MFSQNNNKWYFPFKRSRIKKRRQILCSYHIPAQYRNGQEKTIEDIGSEIVQSTNIHKRPDEEEEFAFRRNQETFAVIYFVALSILRLWLNDYGDASTISICGTNLVLSIPFSFLPFFFTDFVHKIQLGCFTKIGYFLLRHFFST